ncbi:site-specific recombinase xerd [Natronobacterium gregoryi SP2]|uniref:Site-specific recombinase xerd n=1 Tax=Natronobacterium gregoryi (strain ATCC 43098 / DSM 3393 / CCM 3738 / CIP 104747 / IAM 13177 / JCM 8860 / NBRC 102187 / NCIMB 2189 / SP2) TaxID=797304 RepID=L9XWL4_NATGS|nr:site-specific recombinase xerd [Natronobacterium gregoryi SP2]
MTDEEALYLENWLDQRELMERYDGRDEIWLNRKANPYDSGPLNDLLDNLMEEADIETRGRKLVWYSFRHSIGTYVYDEYRDLEIVAEQLRQTTTSAASKYVHKLPELKREAAELM